MKTTTHRAIAFAGALALTLGSAACSKSDPAPTTASTSTSTTSATSAPSTPAETAPTTPDSPAADASQAADVLAKAKASAEAAKSGAFKGEVKQDGKKMSLDFKGTSDGSTADVTVALEGEGKVRIISVGGSAYMQADETFWKAQDAPAEVQKSGAKFVKVPIEAAGLTQSLNLSAFLSQAFTAVSADKLSDTVGEESVDGVDCWVLTDKSGKDNGALYVAKDSYQLVRFTGSVDSPGVLEFSQWDEDLGITAPAASEIIAIN